MDKVKKVLDPLTCALVVLAIALLVLLFQTRAMMEERASRDVQPADTLISFLDSYTSAIGIVERQKVVETYIDGASAEEKDHDGRTPTLNKFDAVFMPSESQGSGYRVCTSQRNYLEIMPLNQKGEDQPCRIAIYYRVTGQGKIGSYMVTRLQPLERTSEEWRSEWQ